MAAVFREYKPSDRELCLKLFDANCPQFFAPNERDEFAEFLDTLPAGYELCVQGESVLGAFGVTAENEHSARINWIMLDPAHKGHGTGAKMMHRAIDVARQSGARTMHIAASQYSSGFFARYGAVETKSTADGWGPGMDRIDMEVDLESVST